MVELLKSIGLPFAYSHFAEGESPEPPFLLYLYPESHNYGADNIVWKEINKVYLEVYTDKKDILVEKKIEKALMEKGIYWEKSETWIETEKLYEVLYSFELEER